jgi:coenzyme F420-reducing hydrogenase beta subunit
MTEDVEGFLLPSVEQSSCVDCKLCEKVCPVLNPVLMGAEKPSAYAMWSNQDRRISSSGGAFSAFARLVLARGGVVFGTVYDNAMRLHHVETDTVDGLNAMRGSKYMQSDTEESYRKVKDYLKEGRWVLFTGTPCQVAGLRSYLRKDYETLLTLDLACHGVPSSKIFHSYIEKLQKRLGFAEKGLHIENYEFRRRDGWGFSPSISTASNCRNLYGVDALYMEAFNACAIFRESCFHCDYAKVPRVGDCTIADFWGIGRYGTAFPHNTRKGVSLVLVNTSKGKDALKELQDVFIEERELQEALVENHNLKAVSKRYPQRDDVIKAFLDSDISLDEINNRYNLLDNSLKGRVKTLADKIGLFDVAKAVYDTYKVWKGKKS